MYVFFFVFWVTKTCQGCSGCNSLRVMIVLQGASTVLALPQLGKHHLRDLSGQQVLTLPLWLCCCGLCCRYVGRLKSNGKVFDKTGAKPFAFRLGEHASTGCMGRKLEFTRAEAASLPNATQPRLSTVIAAPCCSVCISSVHIYTRQVDALKIPCMELIAVCLFKLQHTYWHCDGVLTSCLGCAGCVPDRCG